MSMLDLGPAARQVALLLDGIADDDLTRPTPCEDTPVGALLDHFMGLTLAFTWAARKAIPPEHRDNPPGPGSADARNLDPDWRRLLPRRLDDLAAAWRDPSAWQGMTEAGGVTMPAEVMGVVAVDELVLHGWDLAKATSQPFECDPDSQAAVLDFTRSMATPEHAASRHGLFGPVVPVPHDAPPLHQALGLAGRDPGWRPTPATHGVPRAGVSAAR